MSPPSCRIGRSPDKRSLLPSALPSMPLCLACVFIFLQGCCGTICPVKDCVDQYVKGKDSGIKEGPSWRYCSLLQEYMDCMQNFEASCRGNLLFHSFQKMVSVFMTKFKCLKVLEAPVPPEEMEASRQTTLPPAPDGCDFEGPNEPVQCSLFGDPHLKTFEGRFMTCRVQGAWSLMTNALIAIQVTNEPVGSTHTATASTKITVIVKTHNPCTMEKTYEASVDNLPRAFVDGTSWSGGSQGRPAVFVVEEKPSRHVVLHIRHANSKIVIRRIGSYLTVSVQIPRVLLENPDHSILHLCHQGCPDIERIDKGYGGSQSRVSQPAMTKDEAAQLCRSRNLTDYFLDSCMFDLTATGDKSFIAAALEAQNDLWQQDPISAYSILKNCSVPPCVWTISRSPQSSVNVVGVHVIILTIIGVRLLI